MTEYSGPAKSDDELEAYGDRLRRVLGIPEDDPQPDLAAALETAQKVRIGPFAGFRYELLSDAEMAGAEAYVEFDPPRMYIARSVYERVLMRDPRANFTIAHEFSHILLGHKGARKHRFATSVERPKFIQPAKAVERQANRVASAFLAPKSLVVALATSQELVALCNISRQAAAVRFEQVSRRYVGKSTPPDIAEAIAALKRSTVDARRQMSSVLSEDQRRDLAWMLADKVDGLDPDEYRSVDGRWFIRKSRFNHSVVGGWRLVDDKIIPWERDNT